MPPEQDSCVQLTLAYPSDQQQWQIRLYGGELEPLVDAHVSLFTPEALDGFVAPTRYARPYRPESVSRMKICGR